MSYQLELHWICLLIVLTSAKWHCVAAGGYDAPGVQQRYGSSEIVEEENEKMASVLADKVKALNSVSYVTSSLAKS